MNRIHNEWKRAIPVRLRSDRGKNRKSLPAAVQETLPVGSAEFEEFPVPYQQAEFSVRKSLKFAHGIQTEESRNGAIPSAIVTGPKEFPNDL